MGLFSGLGKILKAPLNLHKGIIRNAAPGNVKKNTLKLFGMSGGKGGGAAATPQGVPFMNQGSPLMSNPFMQFAQGTLNDPSMFARPAAANFMARMMGQQGPAWANGGSPWGNVPQASGNPFGVVFGGKLPPAQMGPNTPTSHLNRPQYGDAPEPGMAYAGGTPGFYNPGGPGFSSYGSYTGPGSFLMNYGSSPFMGLAGGSFGGGGTPGPSSMLSTILRRYAGTLGNGGGVMAPNSLRGMWGGGSGAGMNTY